MSPYTSELNDDQAERLARVEARLAKVEQLVDGAFTAYEQFLAGTGRKLARLFGIELPRAR